MLLKNQWSISDLHLGGAVPHPLEKIKLFIKEEQQDIRKTTCLCSLMYSTSKVKAYRVEIIKRAEFNRKIVM